jgi:hypothetical protein
MLKVFNRKDLTIDYGCSVNKYKCMLCGRRWRTKFIPHDPDCIFANNAVTGVRVDGISGGIVFHPVEDHKVWVSAASGEVYRIDKWPNSWVLLDKRGNVVKQTCYLTMLRQWVGLNQGVL